MDIYLTLLSGLVGTLIGGLITWLTTRYTLNRQFKEERIRLILQERKNEMIALNSVLKEIEFNLIELINIENIMKSTNSDFINFKASNAHHTLKKDKWDKHSDTIDMIDDLDFLNKLQAFYMNISHEIVKQAASLERVTKLLDMGMFLKKEIESYIADYKTER